MYGEKHSFVGKHCPEKFIFGLNLYQLLAILAAGKVSYEFSKFTPMLPFDNILLRHLHHAIPLYLAVLLAFLHDNIVGRYMFFSLVDKFRAKIRRRVFVYQREDVDID
ncbi:MAG: hypothetical protein HGA27_03735 [Peptococcaceae bacterium]|nr:hypothetical protein [Peptococcaceae bacterium]